MTEINIGCAIEVHKAHGLGLLESAYEECLFYELKKTGLYIQKQKPMSIIYKEVKPRLWLSHGYRSR